MRWLILAACAALAACDVPQPTSQGPGPVPVPQAQSGPTLSPAQAARAFRRVVDNVEPVAERECRARTPDLNCDFLIVVDTRGEAPANAYQSLDRTGRPVLTFTVRLLAQARNEEEIAFIMGHEAAHHIQRHLARQQQNAMAGALLVGIVAAATGANAGGIQDAQRAGAYVGARTYSKNFELEADQLGAVITYNAGYDPLVGALFFSRIPDPGNRFLGTHPPNAQRYQTVVETMRQLQ
jgi:Zn-dependent protease with chaperone function